MIGSPRVHHRLTDSTNERAKELALAGAPHGTLVTADEQTTGRGRQGREWTAPPRSAVLMSVVLRELDEMLPLAAAVAVAEAVPVEAAIKWPNDVWIDGRKVAGILVEGRPQEGWAVLGVGLNVSTEAFPAELVQSATSLYLSGIEAQPESVLASILRQLDDWLGAPPARVLEAWRSRDALKGQRVRWAGGDGVASGVDGSGALVVETSAGLVTLDAGEVHLLR
jgi:BirA family transcriptional regulator, biotin operon repressor / biotin---[acetyl-CoA-carboxylase] ligase